MFLLAGPKNLILCILYTLYRFFVKTFGASLCVR